MLPDCLLDYPTTPSGKARGTTLTPRNLRPTFKKPEPNFPFARLARELCGNNATDFGEEDVDNGKSSRKKKSRDDISALGNPCSSPSCIWRKATHYLLEDVQWLNHLVNTPGPKATEIVELQQEIESLRLKTQMLETKNNELAKGKAKEIQATEKLMSQMREENITLMDRIETNSQKMMLMHREIDELKSELEQSEEHVRRVELEQAQEQERHQEVLDAVKMEFENATLSVELLTDDKRRVLAMLETYRGKKGRRRSSTMMNKSSGGAKERPDSGGESKLKKEGGRRKSLKGKKQ